MLKGQQQRCTAQPRRYMLYLPSSYSVVRRPLAGEAQVIGREILKDAIVLKGQANARVSNFLYYLFICQRLQNPLEISAHITLSTKEQSTSAYSECFMKCQGCTKIQKYSKAFFTISTSRSIVVGFA